MLQGEYVNRAPDAAAANMLASDNRQGIHFFGYAKEAQQTLRPDAGSVFANADRLQLEHGCASLPAAPPVVCLSSESSGATALHLASCLRRLSDARRRGAYSCIAVHTWNEQKSPCSKAAELRLDPWLHKQ